MQAERKEGRIRQTARQTVVEKTRERENENEMIRK